MIIPFKHPTASSTSEFRYDVFLSHSSKDKDLVRPIAQRLRDAGLKVWFDEWEIQAGDHIPRRIDDGLEDSHSLMLCMSANAFGSDWAQLEMGTFRFRDPMNKQRRFIPLRLDDAPIKSNLAQFAYITWPQTPDEKDYAKLIARCRQVGEPAETVACEEATGQIAANHGGAPRGVTTSIVKRLFARSGNKCAMPDCKSSIVIGDLVLGGICYIRDRRKCKPRYDRWLTPSQKIDIDNLILLCRTCQTGVDCNPDEFTPDYLQHLKKLHEGQTPEPLEMTQDDVRQAMLLFTAHMAKNRRCTCAKKSAEGSGASRACADRGGVAVSIAGPNTGDISIKVPASRASGTRYPANSIGADANMTNYIEYLCDLYVKYMKLVEPDENVSWAKIGKHIKSRFRLAKRTRNHLSAERFPDLVDFIVSEKLPATPVGRRQMSRGLRLCRSFDEYRNDRM